MSVRVEGDTVHLAGRCLAEDAEALLVALQEGAQIVDLAKVQRMHLAVAQVLLSARPAVQGSPDNAFLARYFVNLLQ